jgi:hypothetical protein
VRISVTLALESAKLLGLSAEMSDSQTSTSRAFKRRSLRDGRPLRYRLETNAAVCEAMAITSVLFSGLGFVALIATVWLQRRQIEAAIQSMEESTKAQQENLETLRAQSENTLAVAKISALAVRISAYTPEILEAAIRDPVKKNVLEQERKCLIEELDMRTPKAEGEREVRLVFRSNTPVFGELKSGAGTK